MLAHLLRGFTHRSQALSHATRHNRGPHTGTGTSQRLCGSQLGPTTHFPASLSVTGPLSGPLSVLPGSSQCHWVSLSAVLSAAGLLSVLRVGQRLGQTHQKLFVLHAPVLLPDQLFSTAALLRQQERPLHVHQLLK